MHRVLLLALAVITFGGLVYSVPRSLCAADYKGPNAAAVSPDEKFLYIANTDACEIAVIDTATDKIVRTISLDGVAPYDVKCSADGKTLYIAGGHENGKFIKVNTDGRKKIAVNAGHTPYGLALSPDGKKAYVCNRFSTDVWEYNLAPQGSGTMKLVRKIKTIREPRAAVVTKDNRYVLVCNSIPFDIGNKPEDENALIDVAAEVSVISVADGSVKQVRLPNGSGSLHGIALSPDGRYAYVTEVLARFQIPTTQVERGWMNTAGIAIIDITQLAGKNNGFVNSVLLDDVDLGAANPWGITTSADGKTIYVAVAGTSELIVINAEGMHKKLAELGTQYDMEAGWGGNESEEINKANEVPNDLSFLVGLKQRKIVPGKGARAIALAGGNIYIGMYFSDTVQKVNSENFSLLDIPLGKTPLDIEKLPAARRGEIWWNDATLCFQKWQSCASCHPDMRMDGYNWDLMNDGLGNPKNAKSLLYSLKTTPSMWEAVRDNPEKDKKEGKEAWVTAEKGLQCVRTGFQFIQFAQPDEAKCKDIDAFIAAEKAVPSPYLVNGKLSAKAERGKKVFDDPKVGCVTCHPADNYFTDQKVHDVNTKCYYDRINEFDTPTLYEVWRTAPYLHDGRYKTIKELFKNKEQVHGDGQYGDVAGLTDEQIDDLCEYILSL